VRLFYLVGINVCAHLRSQLNDPIPVPEDDDNTLPQLLYKPITSFSVKLSKRTQRLSDVFPSLPEDHLHIIHVRKHTVICVWETDNLSPFLL